jgi:hypothetical protein
MRHGLGVIAAVLAALAAVPARAQEPALQYWPLREISFPVSLEKIKESHPRTAKVRFYVARDRGRFEREAERALDDLDVIDDRNRRGFRYTSPSDGEYAFALQLVYSDGDVNPRDAELSAHHRVVIDTRPPQVRIAASGRFGVEWEVIDDNPKPDGVELQIRWIGEQTFKPYNPRAFNLRDRFTIPGPTLPTSSQPLEVRVVARDRAGLEGVSAIVTLPAGAGAGTGLPRDPLRPAGSGFGHTNDFLTQPEIRYISSRTMTIESKLTRVTRSGVKAAHLWVNDGKSGWRLARSEPQAITSTDRDPTIRIEHAVEKDGLYGFIVIPENGAGGKQDDPRPGDPAQFLIEVDTDEPVVKVKSVKVSPGGAVGPRVEIEWMAQDKNLFEEPILLEYQTGGGPWQPITPGKVRNSGRYVWEVEDPNLWRFHVRATAWDKASNRSEHVYEKEVLVDLEKPAAVIEKVQEVPGGPPAKRDNERPSSGPGSNPLPGGSPPVPTLPGGDPGRE